MEKFYSAFLVVKSAKEQVPGGSDIASAMSIVLQELTKKNMILNQKETTFRGSCQLITINLN